MGRVVCVCVNQPLSVQYTPVVHIFQFNCPIQFALWDKTSFILLPAFSPTFTYYPIFFLLDLFFITFYIFPVQLSCIHFFSHDVTVADILFVQKIWKMREDIVVHRIAQKITNSQTQVFDPLSSNMRYLLCIKTIFAFLPMIFFLYSLFLLGGGGGG